MNKSKYISDDMNRLIKEEGTGASEYSYDDERNIAMVEQDGETEKYEYS